MSKTSSWGVGAWTAGLAFQQVVEKIAATDGPNGITKAKILEGLKAMQSDGSFNGNGIYGDKLNIGGPGTCFVMMQVQNGKFVRDLPEEKGKLSCPDDALQPMSIDPARPSPADVVNVREVVTGLSGHNLTKPAVWRPDPQPPGPPASRRRSAPARRRRRANDGWCHAAPRRRRGRARPEPGRADPSRSARR